MEKTLLRKLRDEGRNCVFWERYIEKARTRKVTRRVRERRDGKGMGRGRGRGPGKCG